MNTKIRMLVMLVAVVLTFGLFSFEQPTSAQSARDRFGLYGNSTQSAAAQSPNSNCKQLKGTEVDLFDPVAGVANGTITNAGFLNGTTVLSFTTGGMFTQDPNVVVFLADLTITTVDGQLTAHTVTTFNIVTGLHGTWGNIDPNASTGRFAGATGAIFFDDAIPPADVAFGPYTHSVGGQICFAQ
jgi:hypothetical protein